MLDVDGISLAWDMVATILLWIRTEYSTLGARFYLTIFYLFLCIKYFDFYLAFSSSG